MGVTALKMNGEMNVEQAAEYIGISKSRLYSVISEGQGPRHVKRFGRLIFLAGDLDAWLKQITVVKRAFGR